MAQYAIRVIGDPVLKERAREIEDIDSKLVRLVDDMFTTMHQAPGIGLAAPQVGVRKRMFVYEIDGTPGVLINPVIEETRGEWVFQEGCLSIPGVYFEIARPKEIYVTGVDLDGNEVHIEADELMARLIQHEYDHLDGTLMVEHLVDEQRKEANKALRELALREGRRPDPEEPPTIIHLP